ncbi:shikimate dehydrogenase family protein [Saccharospirillum impatiens]|uniref:shikimate dehydrogenase family protein n=1 Tax=Saccharospirillum impatiens TaxID=169438 RepID=UPI0003F88BEC|nr:shikimate dehydrogenase [Saccharospirillum impatiens]
MTPAPASFQLNGNTRIVPMLGDPIGQVKAPSGLTPALQHRGLNALVVPWHVRASDLESTLAALLTVQNVPGVVLTLPHKLDAYPLCDQTSARAHIIGAVNVLRKNKAGGWYGDHTDGIGYLNGLRSRGFNVTDCRALVIGAGGSGSAIAWELLEQGAQQVAIYDVDPARAKALVGRLNSLFSGKVKLSDNQPEGYDLLANASPAGMKPNDPYPVRLEGILPHQLLADAITEPAVTPFLEYGTRLGCRTMNGADMFNGQVEALADILFPETADSYNDHHQES